MAGAILRASKFRFLHKNAKLNSTSFQFVGNLWNEESMNARLNGVLEVCQARGLTFRA